MNGLHSKGKEKEIVFEPDTTADFSDGDGNGLLNGDENLGDMSEVQDIINSFNDENGEPTGAEEDVEDDLFSATGRNEEDVSEAESPAPEPSKVDREPAARRNARSKNQAPQRALKSNTTETDGTSKRKRAGRPPKSQRGEDETVERRPAKKAKTTEQTSQDPKATGNAELDKVVENYVNRTGPLKGRSLYILKREAPDQTATHTRSGRASVRPLAYWRNERCVYGDGEAEVGQRFPLTTIKEIIRTEELEPERRTGSKRKSSKKSKSKKNPDDESEDDSQDNTDPWEREGSLHGYVRKWDPETQTTVDDDEVLGMY